MKWLLNLLSLITVFSFNSLAISQNSPRNLPDRFGDYYYNTATQRGTVSPSSRLSPGPLWRVRVNSLNCRTQPGINSPIVRQFNQGDTIQVDVGRGGSDEVLINGKDATGKPWMPVRGKEGEPLSREKRCYVRAHRRYIQPLE